MKAPKTSVDAVIFDIDNVLIDTRHSYLDAIRWTIQIYLTHGSVPIFHKDALSKDTLLLSAHDVDRFKLLGGFNDDWDCCYGLLIYILSLPVGKRTLAELKRKIDIKALGAKIPARPVGVNGIVKHCNRTLHITIEKISRIFQEVYLGPELFLATERKRAVYWKKRGLIYKEKLIFKEPMLQKLRDMGIRMGIATGRPQFEAVLSLKHFGVLQYFDAMTTVDEVKKAERDQKQSLRKPNPYSLLQTAKKIGLDHKFMYVGDLPDDMLATQRAKEVLSIRSVAFPTYTSDPETTAKELQKTHPDFIIARPSDLLKVVKK
jgi:phosphoglycolate phosphatase-like HAD superfamily hydrolase